MRWMFLLLIASQFAAAPTRRQDRYFAIEVVDQATGRGVPLIELTTVHGLRCVTDSHGVAAFYEPGLMGQKVFFSVAGHGYEFPPDGFGFQGKALDVTEGGSARLHVNRVNIAQRLYRVTGAGIYRDSLLVGRPVPIDQPALNALVLGSDSVVTALYRGKLWWFWGDTTRAAYPLGNFNVPGATSLLPADGGIDPDLGVNLRYFKDQDGFARPMASMPGEGPTWIISLIPLTLDNGESRLYASYVKVRGSLDVYARGLAVFDDDAKSFIPSTEFDMRKPLVANGHPFAHSVDGLQYLYFASPLPFTRVPATPQALADQDSYQTFTCLVPGSRFDPKLPRKASLDRDPQGRLLWDWKKDTSPVGPLAQRQLIDAGLMRPDEAAIPLQDTATQKPVAAHAGSVYYNDWRRRWIMIAVEQGGTSLLGEVWYAEADSPLGPWVYARKVVTHDRYSFYNPKHHPQFDQQGGRIIYFEGTYTHTFSGNADRTPRYDYNQVMYKLDLADRRLALPVAVYDLAEPRSPSRLALGAAPRTGPSLPRRVAFFALDRPGPETIEVHAAPHAGSGPLVLSTGDGADDSTLLFHALEARASDPPAATTPLYEYAQVDGPGRIYSTQQSLDLPGYLRNEEPLCRVWINPSTIQLPWD